MNLRSNHWLPHDTDFQRSEFQIVDLHGPPYSVYSTIKAIGASKYGRLYTGVPQGFDAATLVAQHVKPTLVLKSYAKLAGESQEALLARARREMALSEFARVLDRRNETKFCSADALCVEKVFAAEASETTGEHEVYAVFPFKDAITLQSFLVKHFYGSYKPGNDLKYRIQALNIAVMLGGILENINAAGIFHGDVHPDNILVTFTHDDPNDVPVVVDVRLVNFDTNSCVLITNIYAGLMAAQSATSSTSADIRSLSCARSFNANLFVYSDMATFRDRAIPNEIANTANNRDRELTRIRTTYKRAELYSYGMVVQLLFDVDQNVPNTTPVVRKSARSPGGVTDLIAEMTEDFADRPEITTFVKQFADLRDYMQKNGKSLNVSDKKRPADVVK